MKGNLFQLKKGKMKKKKILQKKELTAYNQKDRKKMILQERKEVTDKVKDHDNKTLNHCRFNFYAFSC